MASPWQYVGKHIKGKLHHELVLNVSDKPVYQD